MKRFDVNLNQLPFSCHMGDVTSASADDKGIGIMEVASDISHKAGGPVGIMFSVCSAISNGAMS